MATTQQYSLRWNNYFRHLTYAMENHRLNDEFVDVSLFCDGRKIKAHKVVLSSCSSYFKEIFKENPHPHPVIIFKFIKYEDLNSIIEFMYQGEVNVQQEALQSFLQTAELLAVQGLTAEEKEKPKPPLPIVDEQKLIRTIPTTIRAISDPLSTVQTQTQQSSTQTIEIPASALLQQPTQTLHATTTSGTHHQIQNVVQQQTQQPQTINMQQIQSSTHHQPTQQHQHHQHQQQLTTVTLPVASNKKRKITFSDDDDNIYTAETVDEQTIVKTSDMAFLRGTVKMDIPEYIVSDVEDPQLSDGTTHQTSQDAGNESGQNVTQYTTSEYEILTESEIEEKYNQGDTDNTQISIDVGRLLNPTTGNPPSSNTHDALDDAGGTTGATTLTTVTLKTDNKSSSTTDLTNNKWTECQFCKMVITTVNLWRHIRTQHTPQPPRKCDFCNKSFKNKYSLREHIRISHEQKIGSKAEN